MTTPHEPAPRQRPRRLWLALVVVLLLVAVAGFYRLGWVRSLSDEERPFVGTWRLESPVFSPARPELVNEFDLLPNGTWRYRVWDSRTGAVVQEGTNPGRWRVSGGRFQEVEVEKNPLLALERGGWTQMLLDRPVTWAGPDRFRWPGASPARPDIFTWTRCDRPGGR